MRETCEVVGYNGVKAKASSLGIALNLGRGCKTRVERPDSCFWKGNQGVWVISSPTW